jgi:hypothetical protein
MAVILDTIEGLPAARRPKLEPPAALRDGCKSSFRWTLWPLLARVPVGAGDDELKRRVWD